MILAVILADSGPTRAVPPYRTVMRQVERFRSLTGDVVGQGWLTYGPFHRVAVRIERRWDRAPLLTWDHNTLELSWEDTGVDVVLRLVGAALAAEDLSEALAALGRSLEPEVAGLVLVVQEVAYLIGAPTAAPAVRITVGRDAYELWRIELPMPEGVYLLEMEDYVLAEGWFPRMIAVSRGERTLFLLELESVSPAGG